MHKRCVLSFGLSNKEETKIFLDVVQISLNARTMSLSVGNGFRFLSERTLRLINECFFNLMYL